MTIREVLEQGIQIQGAVCVKKWDEEKENYQHFLRHQNFEVVSKEYGFFEMEITYMYCENGELVIEVEDERGN